MGNIDILVGSSISDAAAEAEVDDGTAIDVYHWLREICSSALLRTPIVLGGNGIVVQIDESVFSHKPKVKKINFHAVSRYRYKIATNW